MRVLITGGAGYIGSHTLIEIINNSHQVVVIDNYSNSEKEIISRISQISKNAITIIDIDIREKKLLKNVFSEFRPEAVIHFAGLKSVNESITKPTLYHDVNISGTISLLECMEHSGCHRIVFSSSATVYGNPQYLPIDEKHPCLPANPYGRSKLIAEQILEDWQRSNQCNSAVILRYFNPIGAHFSGLIGETPKGIPNNLLPYITQVASGRLEKLFVFGDDFETPDGTGIRDYIHVSDLASVHVAALNYSLSKNKTSIFNVGTGRGYSVLEIIKAFEKASGTRIPYEIKPRRPGDVAVSVANVNYANSELGWKAKFGIFDMCTDAWRYELEKISY
jgi:UDP-glucose 4-epimerase